LPTVPLDDDIVARLQTYDWPGNVRELKNLVERSLILGCFPLDALSEAGVKETAASAAALDAVEKSHILEVLAASGGNKSEAARRLGVSRKTVERKLAQWGA
jgi:DNA-binding NtrC family response regulator